MNGQGAGAQCDKFFIHQAGECPTTFHRVANASQVLQAPNTNDEALTLGDILESLIGSHDCCFEEENLDQAQLDLEDVEKRGATVKIKGQTSTEDCAGCERKRLLRLDLKSSRN